MISLDLPYNQLTGSLPSELGNLSDLKVLLLGRNEFTGSLPRELGNLLNLTGLILSGNRLTGSIPRSFLQLQVLRHFSFRHNWGLCAPPDDEFQTWLSNLQSGGDGALCQL